MFSAIGSSKGGDHRFSTGLVQYCLTCALMVLIRLVGGPWIAVWASMTVSIVVAASGCTWSAVNTRARGLASVTLRMTTCGGS
ncbi:Uncharacterised protein [Mycobacteroides abscessus subsp. abscessus]|nr:Uncharacterised protein [Mycobacteroides abscessus subsp. abscessus]